MWFAGNWSWACNLGEARRQRIMTNERIDSCFRTVAAVSCISGEEHGVLS
jgi:hypothetical protein